MCDWETFHFKLVSSEASSPINVVIYELIECSATLCHLICVLTALAEPLVIDIPMELFLRSHAVVVKGHFKAILTYD